MADIGSLLHSIDKSKEKDMAYLAFFASDFGMRRLERFPGNISELPFAESDAGNYNSLQERQLRQAVDQPPFRRAGAVGVYAIFLL